VPEHALQLMRSRFSAYVLNNLGYINETWHPRFRPVELQLDDTIKWLKLDIISSNETADQAEVEFEATLLESGRVDAIHEKSQFVQERGRWLYTSGEMKAPSFSCWNPGRNETCPCGSGKKFKRCCGR
jgi:SEC-C motif-containing protein